MSSTQVFNYVTFYKALRYSSYSTEHTEGFEEALEFYKTMPVSTFNISRDLISTQKSKIILEYDEGIQEGFYGIFKNNNNQSILFKVVDKTFKNDNTMELSLYTGTEIIDLEEAYIGEEGQFVIDDVCSYLETAIVQNRTFNLGINTYRFSGDEISKTIDVKKNSIIEAKSILNALILDGNTKITNDIFSKKVYNYDIDFELKTYNYFQFYLNEYTPENIVIDLRDTTAVVDYEILYSDEIVPYFTIVSTQNYQYQDYYDNTIETNRMGFKLNLNTGDKTYYEGYGIGGDIVIYEWDSEKTNEENIALMVEKGYSLLDKMKYNHQIEARILLDNPIINTENLDEILLNNYTLVVEKEEIPTKITKYEYSGDNTITVTFGNIRTKLTEKLRMKGVI